MDFEFYFERLGFNTFIEHLNSEQDALNFAIEFEATKFRKVGEENWKIVYEYRDGIFTYVFNE